jgi:ADP-ribosylglycohydrolase
MEFIINYGRDNDTTGALAGAILGAYHGASGLPQDLVETVLTTNRENLDIDLEKVAETLTEAIWRRHPGNLSPSTGKLKNN